MVGLCEDSVPTVTLKSAWIPAFLNYSFITALLHAFLLIVAGLPGLAGLLRPGGVGGGGGDRMAGLGVVMSQMMQDPAMQVSYQ